MSISCVFGHKWNDWKTQKVIVLVTVAGWSHEEPRWEIKRQCDRCGKQQIHFTKVGVDLPTGR